MSSAMEDIKSVNTLEEVKKLQELVRKLEIQNLHLRNKQNKAVSLTKAVKSSPRSGTVCSDSNASGFEETIPFQERKTDKVEYFDDLDIIPVSDIEMSDDESWLFSSPNCKQKPSEAQFHPGPGKDLQFSKNALLAKLNELEILSSPRSFPDLMNKNICYSQNTSKTPCIPVSKHETVRIDSRTFTRSQKKEALDFLEKLDLSKNENSDGRVNELSLDSTSSYVLEDANDVQEVARLQEESLRRNSSFSTPRRLLGCLTSKSTLTFTKKSGSDQDIFERTATASALSSNEVHIQCMDEPCHTSDNSSHSESPYGSNSSLHNVERDAKYGTYRRSLPNLNRDPTLTKASHTRAVLKARTASSASEDCGSFNQKSQRPTKYSAKTEISKMSTPENNNTMNVLPKSADSVNRRLNAKSGLPRASRASSSSRSVSRSGIPMSSMSNKKYGEDSWSEGCY